MPLILPHTLEPANSGLLNYAIAAMLHPAVVMTSLYAYWAPTSSQAPPITLHFYDAAGDVIQAKFRRANHRLCLRLVTPMRMPTRGATPLCPVAL